MTESQTSNSYIDSDFRSERFSARPLSAYSPNRPGCLPPFAIVAARILARAVFRAFARRRRGSRPEDDARVFVATKKSRFHRAAELGNVYSWASVGFHYFNGTGVKVDRKKAARCYRIGADNGEPWAQNNLAYCYKLGAGVPRDVGTAKRLYTLAAAQGLQCANANLQRFSNAP